MELEHQHFRKVKNSYTHKYWLIELDLFPIEFANNVFGIVVNFKECVE